MDFTPGGPCMSAISGAERLKRTASFCESFKVSSMNFISMKSCTAEGFVRPRSILAREDNSLTGVSRNFSIVSLIRLNVTSFANLTLNSVIFLDSVTANSEFQIQKESVRLYVMTM